MAITAPLTRTLIADLDTMESLRPAWEELLQRSRTNEPTLSPTWMLAWWRVFGRDGDRSLRALAFHEGDRLVGLAPLLSRPASYRPGIPFQRLELLASGEDEADETCSDYLGLLADEEHEQRVVDAFASAALGGELGPWDEALFRAMKGEGNGPTLLADAFRARGLECEIKPGPISPYIPLPSTFEKYLAELAPKHRYLVRKSLRAYEEWAGTPPRLKLAQTRDELAAAQKVLIDLHRERWAESGDSGVFDSVRFRAFHERVMPELLDKGALWVGSIEAKGAPIAAFYNIIWNGTSYFYQSGRKVGLPKHVRVGIVMHAALIRAAIEAGLKQYDFLAGDSRYKLDLALATRPMVTVRVAKPSLVETARKTAEMALGQARWLKNSLFRRPRPTQAA